MDTLDFIYIFSGYLMTGLLFLSFSFYISKAEVDENNMILIRRPLVFIFSQLIINTVLWLLI